MKKMDVPFLPVPKQITPNGQRCDVSGTTPCYTNTNASFDYLLTLAGLKVQSVQYKAEGSTLYLALGEYPTEPMPIPTSMDAEAYALTSTEKTIVITAHTVEGLAHGVKLLVRLAKFQMLQTGYEVQDVPDIHFRGVHMCIFRPDDGTEKDDTTLDDIRRRIIVAALAGYNHVFLEFWGMFPYRKQTDAKWPNAWTWEQVTNLVNFIIDDLHMKPCPAQNLTSHAGWSRIISRKHVMLDQHPQREGLYIPGGWCFTTEKEETRAFLRDLIDDLVTAFRNPPFLHCSCDKCYGFGSTEEDRTKPADVLFVNHLCFLNDYLSHKGTRMVMWSDMLYSSMDVMLWKCSPETTNLLPKNILMDIWTHNDPGLYWHDVDFFEDKGFQTIYSPFENRSGARSMVKLCKQHGSLGILQTTWHRPEHALSTVVFSGGAQWGDYADTECNEHIEQCLELYQQS